MTGIVSKVQTSAAAALVLFWSSMDRRRLGSSDLEVSRLSLGSWRTYERIPKDAGVAVMRKAREEGINFLDDARYNDETGEAPLKTGYSEVVFGELFRAAGWKRDQVILANKLWWEFWPEQSAAQELDASLQRMRIDHIDLAYAAEPPEGFALEQLVEDVTALITAGKLRAWGVLNWRPSLIADAARIASRAGVAGPCAAQLPYSLVLRSPVEDAEMVQALEEAKVSVVASYTLYGGALTGKYSQPGAEGRVTARIDERDYSRARSVGEELSRFARKHQARPAAMAVAFALLNSHVASVLFGATRPEQVEENIGAIGILAALDQATIEGLKLIGAR
ncbi:MAG: aldo/keto reductase [Chloroflexi bacterium]|nr:MAG: aldo/keto reductase [Chloroflexota bacterium]